MTLDSIWDGEGEWLTNKSKTFKGKSSGCSCCSSELDSEGEVRKHVVEDLFQVRVLPYGCCNKGVFK